MFDQHSALPPARREKILRTRAADRARRRRTSTSTVPAALAAILREYALIDGDLQRFREPGRAALPLSRTGVRRAALSVGMTLSGDDVAAVHAALVGLALRVAARRAAVTDAEERSIVLAAAEADAMVVWADQAAGRGGAA